MQYQWSPEPETYLIDEMENTDSFFILIKVAQKAAEEPEEGEDPPPNENPVPERISDVTHDLPEFVEVRIDGPEMFLRSDTLMGIFPVGIHTLITRYEVSKIIFQSWNSIEPEHKEIVQMDAPNDPEKTFTISVTATGEEVTETVNYYIRVYTDYDRNRDMLKMEVDKRRFSPIN